MIVSVADFKANMRILHAHEDALIERKILAAQESVMSRIGAEPEDFDPVPARLQEAVLLLAGHLYEHREAPTASALSSVPLTFYDLIRGFRSEWS